MSTNGDDPLFETRSSGSRGFVEVALKLRNGTRDEVRQRVRDLWQQHVTPVVGANPRTEH